MSPKLQPKISEPSSNPFDVIFRAQIVLLLPSTVVHRNTSRAHVPVHNHQRATLKRSRKIYTITSTTTSLRPPTLKRRYPNIRLMSNHKFLHYLDVKVSPFKQGGSFMYFFIVEKYTFTNGRPSTPQPSRQAKLPHRTPLILNYTTL